MVPNTLNTHDTVQSNKALMSRFYEEIFNRGDFSFAREIVSPNFVDHIPASQPGQPTKGPEAIIWFVSMFRTAFPDLHVQVDDMLAIDDTVVGRVTWRGTQTGPLLGADPTGKSVEVMGIDIARITEGRLVEHWGQVDVVGMLDQLGFLPPMTG